MTESCCLLTPLQQPAGQGDGCPCSSQPQHSTHPPGRLGTSPSSSSQELTPSHSGDMACSSCAGPPGRVSSPLYPSHISEHCQTLFTDSSAKEGISVPLLCFTKKEKCMAMSDIPTDHPTFPRSHMVCLLWRRPCCVRAKIPIHLTQNHPRWSP